MGFDGLPSVIDRIGRLADEAGFAAKSIARLNEELQRAGSNATAMEGHPGFAAGEAFSVEALNRGGPRVDPALGAAFTKLLDELSQRIEKVMGPDNYIAKFLEAELPYLKSGARSAQEAQALIQNNLLSFLPGLQRELADPSTPKEVRNLLNELIQLALSGNFIAKQTHDAVKDAGKKLEAVATVVAGIPDQTNRTITDEINRFLFAGALGSSPSP